MATLYCGPSATGNEDGSNFSNLLALPTTTGFTRGNTYIIIDGSYGSRTLSTATSGSTTITIKKASSADSGVTGYAASLHDGEATFGEFYLTTGYWIIDGVTRTETDAWAAPAGYGIRCSSITINGFEEYDGGGSSFSYCDIGGAWTTTPSSGTLDTYDNGTYWVAQDGPITLSRCAIHNVTQCMMVHWSSNLTIEYCHFGPSWGKEAIAAASGTLNDSTIRFNRFWNAGRKNNDPTSGLTAEIGAFHGGENANVKIYGNWFYSTVTDSGRNQCILIGSAEDEVHPESPATNCLVYNNTFAGIADDASPMIWLYGGSGNEAKNNLFYDCASNGVTANTTANNVTATSDPFVNYATLDLHITSGSQAQNAGTALASGYNSDPDGNTRGGDGTWDVGAYEYGTTGSTVSKVLGSAVSGISKFLGAAKANINKILGTNF